MAHDSLTCGQLAVSAAAPFQPERQNTGNEWAPENEEECSGS